MNLYSAKDAATLLANQQANTTNQVSAFGPPISQLLLLPSPQSVVVEDLVKEGREKRGAERGFCWILLGFEEEGVAVEGNRWSHWKEGQKLGGSAPQRQNGWSKTTGATDLQRVLEVNWVQVCIWF
ncbi:hypothetical protein BY996DRAFT_6557083 [Phakopsora pachyrhizi]|uniref:Uncharacterized protein n=1 Tax=Phakopsora pachyrhizi TaxID=170000 RepID=A0AAV0BGG0_PHAPC|nr:hypothetical protein BY996DRAFT_6557083 [Phakopsora pachyrhizi]CAH7684982.1 hypothetical protein PPACK8108_LOCUS19439 [Phakopsora pachyrhizi]